MTQQRKPTAGRPTRERAAHLEEQIRLAAVQAFIAHGFDGVTMEDIAKAAGVGKPTLYSRYSDKRELFKSVIPWALQNLNWLDPLEGNTGGDLEAALLTIARAAHARAVDPETVGLVRMVMAESPRFPEIALDTDELTRSPLVRSVADVLRRHPLAIAPEAVYAAAEQFIGMIHVVPLLYASFGFVRDAAEADAHVSLSVRLFLHGAMTR